jgi:hypothetical protein
MSVYAGRAADGNGAHRRESVLRAAAQMAGNQFSRFFRGGENVSNADDRIASHAGLPA